MHFAEAIAKKVLTGYGTAYLGTVSGAVDGAPMWRRSCGDDLTNPA